MKTKRPEPGRSKQGDASAIALTGHRFHDPGLLAWALTHRSLSYERAPEESAKPSSDNEQLEFIGDAVLGLVVAEALFRRFPDSREGELTRLRASLVSRRHLAEVASSVDLGSMLLLGRGEEQSGGRRKPALLANALEAVIAAVYLDGGLDVARQFIDRVIISPSLPELQAAIETGGTFSGAIGDHKSALQEYMQSSGAGQPHYVLTAQSGPDHSKTFRVEVRVEESNGESRPIAESEGASKKQAQQQAARIALEQAGQPKGSLSGKQPHAGRDLMQTSPPVLAAAVPASPETPPAAAETTHVEPPPAPVFSNGSPKAAARTGQAAIHNGSSSLAAVQSLSSIIVVAIFIVTFSLQPFRIPSASMEPTLLVGDFLLVKQTRTRIARLAQPLSQQHHPSRRRGRLLLPRRPLPSSGQARHRPPGRPAPDARRPRLHQRRRAR